MPAHKKSLMQYMQKTKTGNGLIFIGDLAKVYIPLRYEVHDLLVTGNVIRTLGIFQVSVQGETEPYNLLLPSILSMKPSATVQKKIDEIEYLICSFVKGDIFLESMTVLKQNFVLSKMFIEFIRNGNMPPWLTYDQMGTIFDIAQVTCGASLPVPHAILEMIISHCSRDPDKLSVKYRYTDQKKQPVFLGLRDTTNVRDSTTSRLVGSYVMDGINASIVNQSQQRSEVEDLLRQ